MVTLGKPFLIKEDSQLQKLVASCPHARIHWVCLAKELSAACGR